MKNKLNFKVIIATFFIIMLLISFFKKDEIAYFANLIIAETCVEQKNYKQSTQFYNNCLYLSEKINDKKYLIKSLEFLTSAIIDSNFDQDLEKLFWTFLKDFEKSHKTSDVVALYNDAGLDCIDLNKSNFSEFFFKAAIGKLMENDKYDLADLSLVTYNLGSLYQTQKQYDKLKKIDYLTINLIQERLNDNKFITQHNNSLYDHYRILFLNRLAYTYKTEKNYTESKKYYLQALELAKKQKKPDLDLIPIISAKLKELYKEKDNVLKSKN